MPSGNSGVTPNRPLHWSKSPSPSTYSKSCVKAPIGISVFGLVVPWPGPPINAVKVVGLLASGSDFNL